MRTCSAARCQRGFSYLLLLFALVLGGVALASLGQRWQVALQREREAELLFRGAEIRQALDSYHATVVNGAVSYPATLAELVEDRRQTEVRYHLRRLYLDPFSAGADWDTVRDGDGRITGVRSRSRLPALAQRDLPVLIEPPVGAEEPTRVGDWLFAATGLR